MKIRIGIAALASLVAAVATADAYYASPNGTGDCCSPTSPGLIQDAFKLAANDGDEVVLLSGTYDFTTFSPGLTGKDGYYLKTGKAITIRSQSGKREDVTLDGKNAVAARAFKFIGAATVRDVTLVRFGCLNGPEYGGAIYGAVNATSVVASCVFRNNYSQEYGGAVHLCRVEDSLFEHNALGACSGTSRFGSSGAATSDSECHGCRFVDNCYTNCNATRGGSVSYRGSFYDCTFSNNVIGNVMGYGGMGGTCFKPSVVSNCLFVGNGGWPQQGGAIYGEDDCGTVVYDSVFVGNRAESGGALYSCTAYRCAFTNNLATTSVGGAARMLRAVDCDFYRNFATNKSIRSSGGGAICQGSATRCTFRENWTVASPIGGGGAAFGVAMTNCLVTGNWLYRNGNENNERYKGGVLDNCHIVNCTVVSNAVSPEKVGFVVVGVNTYSGESVKWVGSSEVVNSILVGNVAKSDSLYASFLNSISKAFEATATDLGGNQFVETPEEAGLVAWLPAEPDCGYLKKNSIAIDKGGDVGFTLADFDLRHKKRLNGEKVDLGCYEYWSRQGMTLFVR